MVSPRRMLIRAGSNGKLPVKFDPKRFRLHDSALIFTIEEAKRIRDWPALEQAVNQKIEEEIKFVNWWTVNVTPSRNNASGKRRSNRSETSFSEPAAKELTGIGKVQKMRMMNRLKDPDKYRRDLIHVGNIAAQLADPDNFRAEGTGNNEWHTPKKYVDLARKVLGKIELDPASSAKAQRTVKAKKFFSRDDDGLVQDWQGRVWLNPPYSPKEIASFVGKLCAEFKAGNVTAAVLLTHNYTDSGWFQTAAAVASSLCFTKTRIRFEDPDGVPCSPTQGQAFFYFGKDKELFAKHFAQVGFLATPRVVT